MVDEVEIEVNEVVSGFISTTAVRDTPGRALRADASGRAQRANETSMMACEVGRDCCYRCAPSYGAQLLVRRHRKRKKRRSSVAAQH